MIFDLTTARTLADYKKLIKENQRLKKEIENVENEVIFYIELCEKYEKELLKYEKKERGKRNGN